MRHATGVNWSPAKNFIDEGVGVWKSSRIFKLRQLVSPNYPVELILDETDLLWIVNGDHDEHLQCMASSVQGGVGYVASIIANLHMIHSLGFFAVEEMLGKVPMRALETS